MAREGITRTQVFEAADQISKSGTAPTVSAIRAKLGTGSYTTITAHLRDWKTQARATDDDQDAEVPEEVTTALERAAALVWKAARDHFETELAAIRKAADIKVADAREELQIALEEIERLEANAEELAATESLLDHTARQVRQLETELAEKNAELKACHRQLTEQSNLLMNLTQAQAQPKPTARKTQTKKDEPKPVPVDARTAPLTL